MRFKIASCLVLSALMSAMLMGGCPLVNMRAEDEAQLASLGAEIEEVIAAGSCSVDSDCDVRAIGDACGGPSMYLAYSPATVDEAALAEKILDYNEFEEYMFHRYGFGCQNTIVPVPTVRCENAVCVAVRPAGP